MTSLNSPCAAGISAGALVDEMAAQIVGLAGQLAATTCRWLLLVADFDAREGYLRFGLASTVQWLAHACGIAKRTAIDHLRVAHTLAAHPQLAAEMSAGRISYSQARAIARVARPDEHQLVSDLVEAAQHGTVAHLEVLVRGLRTVEHNEHRHNIDEYARHAWTSTSHWRLSARLDPERVALVAAALEAVAQAEELSAADALVRLAEIALATLKDANHPPRTLRGDERAAVVVHVNACDVPQRASAALEDRARSAEPQRPYAHLERGPGLPDAVVQRLLCAGRVRTALHDANGNVLDVGRSHRLVTERQYRALIRRHDGTCAHPGCPNTRDLHAHHLRHWLHGGRTDMANLILLCARHHTPHHDGAYTITALPDGRHRFVYADGRELPSHRIASTRPAVADDGPVVAPDAPTTRWNGQRLNHGYAISVLAERRQRAASDVNRSDAG